MKNGLEEDTFVEAISSDTMLIDIDRMVCKKNKNIPETILADMENNKE
ncbi:hypothetical protein H8S20_01855 [Clostridium sp. NSJ-6]|uniref:Uncharacterized protein n=1 Tax=Clostridium hominis TaxID=2763036 RepID=A0ABR7D8I3_9CLOT|nr:hypothetical protein [Clostridium hominis]MBC5627628.1 hypothetical protein [Clostridium hominis]MDU2673953.1 hypothetical protein [Clostridium sp.]